VEKWKVGKVDLLFVLEKWKIRKEKKGKSGQVHWTDRLTDRQTDRQTDRWTDRQKGGQTYGCLSI